MTRQTFAKTLWLTVCILALNAWNASALNIILTNDDGYDTENIQALFQALEDAGHDVILSAPFENQSGTSGYVKFLTPIAPPEGQTWGVMMVAEDQYFVASSPVAAVLYGIDVLAPTKWGKGPDLVLSGPNEGNNTGLITVHSGTVGATVTAINKGYPAIALSGAGGFGPVLPATPEINAALSVKLIESLQTSGGPLLPINTGLNVNLPAFAEGTSADDYEFVFTKVGISAQWGLKYYEHLGDSPIGRQYLPPGAHSLPGVIIGNPITAVGYPEDDDPASEQNALNTGVVTISVIEGTYQADAVKEAIVQFKLRDLASAP
jgi:5'-nucleotidase